MHPESYQKAPVSATVVGIGVDWITVTASTPTSQRSLWGVGEQRLSALKSEGQHPARWHGHGYSGWCTTHVALGARGDGSYLRLSSHEARNEWVHAVAASENCTRLDLAVDTEFKTPVTSLLCDLYANRSHWPSRNGRPLSSRLVLSSDGGATLYVGSRASERMGRVYDKGVEQGSHQAGYRYRWEVELKRDACAPALDLLARARSTELAIHRVVTGYFRERLGNLPLRAREIRISNEPRQPTDDDRALTWLAVGVRPTVARLVERFGRGRVAFALGLSLKSDGRELETTNVA